MTLFAVVNSYLRTVAESSQLTCCIPRRGPLIYMHQPVIQSIRPTLARDPRPTPSPSPEIRPPTTLYLRVGVHVVLQCCWECLAWLRICALDYYVWNLVFTSYGHIQRKTTICHKVFYAVVVFFPAKCTLLSFYFPFDVKRQLTLICCLVTSENIPELPLHNPLLSLYVCMTLQVLKKIKSWT